MIAIAASCIGVLGAIGSMYNIVEVSRGRVEGGEGGIVEASRWGEGCVRGWGRVNVGEGRLLGACNEWMVAFLRQI